MKKLYTLRRTLAAAVLLMMSTLSWAYDFYVGKIYYNINEDGESVEVTYKNEDSGDYSGYIAIPSTVTYDNKTYRVTSIGYAAFNRCSSLTSISIPEGVTSIGISTFYHCTSLTSISIPEGVTSIGEQAFCECYSITSIPIPQSVTSIGKLAFYYCTSLTSISIPEGVTSIGDSSFEGCSSLTSISIPKRVTRIGEFAFMKCSSLTSISIPERVTSIGGSAFNSCYSLKSIICYAEKVPTLGSYYVFYNVPQYDATLYVPASALADYGAVYQWRSFRRILPLEDIPAGISNIKEDNTPSTYHTLDGKRVDNPTQKGIYIKNGKKILIK